MKVGFDEAEQVLVNVWMDLNEKSDGRAVAIIAIDDYEGYPPFYVSRVLGDKALIARALRAVLKQMDQEGASK